MVRTGVVPIVAVVALGTESGSRYGALEPPDGGFRATTVSGEATPGSALRTALTEVGD
jgi:hypothetical protein